MRLTRKDFLATMGGLVATSALPTFADDPSMFSQRGELEPHLHAERRADYPMSSLLSAGKQLSQQ